MTALGRPDLPSSGGAIDWLNSEPRGPDELRGHVVLVREHDAIRERTLGITFPEPGAEAYVSTFG